MKLEYAKTLSEKRINGKYKEYLNKQGLEGSTVNTRMFDSFYLLKNAGEDIFWKVLRSDNFEEEARRALQDTLEKNTSENVNSLVNDYLSHLRMLRNFLISDEFVIDDEKDDYDALKDFLLDIDCLDRLSEWTSRFNLFDILKITKTEIRHSNMLAWLLNPNENHGLGDSIIKGFIQYYVISFSDEQDVFDTLLMDCHDFMIQREWNHIDVMAVSTEEKYVLCIENKIDSTEHDNQLDRYKTIIENIYPGYKHAFIYLSPDRSDASDSDNWCSMGYQDVVNIIDNATKKVNIFEEAEILINNYLDAIRRDIVGDERLAQICAEIYSKHQRAIDLIIENKPDNVSNTTDMIKNWASKKTSDGLIILVPEKSTKKYVRFKTTYMSNLLPDASEPLSGWKTCNNYFYEVVNDSGKECYIQLAFNSTNMSDENKSICDAINGVFPSKKNKENWVWRTQYTTKRIKLGDTMDEEKLFEQLDKRLNEIFAFEEEIKTKLK